MSVDRLIKRLREAGLDAHPDDVLDALWLASLGRDLNTVAVPVAEADKLPLPSAPNDADDTRLAPDRPDHESVSGIDRELRQAPAPVLSADGTSPVYGAGDVAAEDVTIPAAGIILPSARTLPNRLSLIRALRPFRRQFPSHAFELDEDRTAELTAEMRAGIGDSVFPVLRPRNERWYEAHVVVEDDPRVELWAAPLREFTQLLGDVGAFRLVRSWRLRLDPAAPADLTRARLESPAGGLSSPGSLGGTRQLIFFASHGLSPHWADGVYARLLAGWPASSAVLLHLQPRSRWGQTLLGEPQALAHSLQPGPRNSALEIKSFWWRPGPDADDPQVVRLPATAIDATSLEAWSRTLMGLARETETFLLDPAAEWTDLPEDTQEAEAQDVQRALATLQEQSPAAYDLAIMLASAPFTLPVARLVQEVTQGGDSDFTVLADLMLSGIISRAGGDAVARETTYFAVGEQARPLLLRALRSADADDLARSLDERISRHLSDIAGRTIQFSALIAYPEGRLRLPVWAQEFAHITSALHNRPGTALSGRTWRDVLKGLDGRVIGHMARLASAGIALGSEVVEEWLWRHIDDPRLIRLSEDQELRFAPEVDGYLRQRQASTPYLGLSIIWADDNPENNAAIVAQLTEARTTVLQAPDTEVALAYARVSACDLVISDMSRGSNDRAGFDLIRSLHEQMASVPIIIFAGYTMTTPERRMAVIDAGAFGGTNRESELLWLIALAALASALRKASPARAAIERQVLDSIADRRRPIEDIPEGEFCTLDELRRSLQGTDYLLPDDRIVGSLLFFQNDRQRSWLIATTRLLLFLLDDPETRRARQLVQRASLLADCSEVIASIDRKGIANLRIGRSGPPWFYSPALFKRPADLEKASRRLLATARDETAPVSPTTTASTSFTPDRARARAALLGINIDCRNDVVLDIVLDAARFQPAPGYDQPISLSRLFCGILTVARRLRDRDETAEPMLHAFETTLSREPWRKVSDNIMAQFKRDDALGARQRLELGFSDSARAALQSAAGHSASAGGIDAGWIVTAMLTPEPEYRESLLYRTLHDLPALRAEVNARAGGHAPVPQKGWSSDADSAALTRSFNSRILSALGYHSILPSFGGVSLGAIGVMRNGSFAPMQTLATLPGGERLLERRAEMTDIFYLSETPRVSHRREDMVSVAFAKRNAFLLQLGDCSVRSYEQPEQLADWIMAAFRDGQWDKKWSIVMQVVEARRVNVLIAGKTDASADYVTARTSADLQDMLADAELVHSTGLAFSLVSQGEFTPLFRLGGLSTSLFREAKFAIS